MTALDRSIHTVTAKIKSHISKHAHQFLDLCQKYKILHLMFINKWSKLLNAYQKNNHAVLLPRNVKQIKNLQAKDRQSVHSTHDALYNVHELVYDLEDVVYKIITFPDLIIVCGLNVVFQELNRIISAVTKTPILLSYDITFQLGDFYVPHYCFVMYYLTKAQ